MKVLITGSKGMLGTTLMESLTEHECIGADLPEYDLTEHDVAFKLIAETRPDVIIHCAAMTNVDLCEKEPEKAYKCNHLMTSYIADACAFYNIKMIYISTDYVFEGNDVALLTEYSEIRKPVNEYGLTKRDGEKCVIESLSQSKSRTYIIARVAWLYGKTGKSFVKTILTKAKEGETLKVVDDQFGTPTSCDYVADQIKTFLKHPELTGIFHCTPLGYTNWFTFAKKILEYSGTKGKVLSCKTKDYPTVAKRPKWSVLEKTEPMADFKQKDWKDDLKEFLSKCNW